jgi:nitrogen fixation NifU-like protein
MNRTPDQPINGPAALPDVDDLYQQVIIDHSKRPRHFGDMPEADHRAEGYNPLCGDRITVFLKLAEGRVKAVSFKGSGCAICTASASMMTERVQGRSAAEVRELFRAFHELVTGQPDQHGAATAALDKLVVFSGVRKYPMRVKCASLPWHTVKAALESSGQTVSTE